MSNSPIVIIGAGPAGSTCAGILAKYGHACVVIEKSKHPRHHVGESLQPASLDILEEHFGIKEIIASQCFAHKYGAEYIWGKTRDPWRILFDQRLENCVDTITEEELLHSDFEKAWQVSRSIFDTILCDAAKRCGADVWENVSVDSVEIEDNAIHSLRLSSGEVIHPKFVVDASGQSCFLGRKMQWYQPVQDLQSIAIYAYFQHAGGVQGVLGRHVQLVVTVEEGWIWFIPVSADITSIGLVTKDQRKYTESEFLQILQRAPIPLNNASMVDVDGHKGLYYARDWSYQCKKFVGRNFALVGDAACFVDPILSGGVDFAIRGAANLALAILRYIENSDTTPLQEYQQMLFKEYQAYLRMARYWYANNSSVDGFFWEAYQEIEQPMHSTPMRAFVYLTSGRYAADQHFAIFQKWQEEKMFTALGVQKEQVQESIRLLRKKHTQK